MKDVVVQNGEEEIEKLDKYFNSWIGKKPCMFIAYEDGNDNKKKNS